MHIGSESQPDPVPHVLQPYPASLSTGRSDPRSGLLRIDQPGSLGCLNRRTVFIKSDEKLSDGAGPLLIVSVNDPNRPTAKKPTDKPSAIQFWADRFRKYARLAQPEPKPVEFADQVDDYLARQDARSLARAKAEKAKWQLNSLRQ